MLKIQNITTGYANHTILQDFSLAVSRGDFLAILGPNGAGKSTLLKALIGFLPYINGTISLDGISLSKISKMDLAKKISLIPQEIYLQFDYRVLDIVLMGRFPYLNYWENYRQEDFDIVEEILEKLNLSAMRDEYFSCLSGGEKQRVMIARALAQDTEIILMDEALSHLDINHQLEIMQLLAKIQKEDGKTIVLISHNINISSEFCNRIVMLKDGQIIADGTAENVITEVNLLKLFGVNINILINPSSQKPNIIYSGVL